MGLKWLRDQFKHLKIVLWAVVAVFVLLVFVDWGTGRQGGPTGSFAVRVGEREISEEQFLRELQNTERQMSSIYGTQWEQIRDQIDLPNQVVQRLISRELLLAEARKVGLSVSDVELRDALLEQFSRDGQFVGQEQYERILRASRMRPYEYEEMIRTELLIDKLNQMVQYGLHVGDDEVEEALRREREVTDFDLIQLRYEPFLTSVTVSDEAIRAHYDGHQDDLRRNEQRVLRYLVVETNRLRRSLPVEDDEIAAYYDEHLSEFVEEEQAHARHILFRVEPSADETSRAEARIRAESVARMVRDGAPFAELAARHSDDPGSRDSGGDLGWFGRGRMVPEFEEAVFTAKPGEVVGPVESEFGYHIIQVEAFQSARQRSLDEVREDVRFRLLEGRAATEAERRAQVLLGDLRAGTIEATDDAWQAIADADEAVTLNVSPPFESTSPVPGVGEAPDLRDQLFKAEVGDVGGPRAIPRGWIVWQLKEIKPEGVPPLDEVRPRVEQDVRRLAALDAAAETARKLAARWEQGADGSTLAGEAGGTLAQAVDHRRGSAVPGMGLLPAIDHEVFMARDGDVVGPVRVDDRAVYIAKVARVERLDPASLEAEKEEVRSRLMAERSSQLLRSILAERQRETVVTVNPALLERFASRG